ncbi:TPA: glycosyltransferase [Vibrio vulnificus]|nr:glycosyltransferase [Vibrio vulnificus]
MKKIINRFLSVKNKKKRIYNIGYGEKRALVSYLSDCYDNLNIYEGGRTNRRECSIVVSVLNSLGYTVDLLDCRDSEPINSRRYDLVFGFGHPFRKSISDKKILYLTEQSPKFSYREELKRIDEYNTINQASLKIERSGVFYEDADIEMSDGFITLGYENKLNLTIDYGIESNRVECVYPTGVPSSISKADFSKQSFLWFGSAGVVHKGLDILCDVFKERPDLDLYVAGDIGRNKKLVPKLKNIHLCGYVEVCSKQFFDLIQTCSFVVLPSCSEGVPTGVITCMQSGLIPICTKVCSIQESQQFGFCLSTPDKNELFALIDKASLLDSEENEYLSKIIQSKSFHNYSESKFTESLKAALSQLLNLNN